MCGLVTKTCMTFSHIYCSLVELPVEPLLTVGCLQNDDCPLYTACKNRQCINPCAERNPCATTADCQVVNHEPVCTCPDGYIGSPLTDCRLRKLTPQILSTLLQFSLNFQHYKYYLIPNNQEGMILSLTQNSCMHH